MATIDAQDAIIGRLGARVAKLLLSGEKVEIINPEKALMKGSLEAAKEKYLSRRGQQNKRTPEESPHWPRAPHLLLRRMMRGMLPYWSKRGREAYKRLHVLAVAPAGAKAQKIPEAKAESKHGTFTLGELCVELGYHRRQAS